MIQTIKQTLKNRSERLLGDNPLKQISAKINVGKTRARRVANTGCQTVGRDDNVV